LQPLRVPAGYPKVCCHRRPFTLCFACRGFNGADFIVRGETARRQERILKTRRHAPGAGQSRAFRIPRAGPTSTQRHHSSSPLIKRPRRGRGEANAIEANTGCADKQRRSRDGGAALAQSARTDTRRNQAKPIRAKPRGERAKTCGAAKGGPPRTAAEARRALRHERQGIGFCHSEAAPAPWRARWQGPPSRTPLGRRPRSRL
jgi:hypothetical protein